jgi:hypothetical protein
MIQTYTIHRPGADIPGDDWSGITDPVLRRKLQNRCNQRAARRRKLVALKASDSQRKATGAPLDWQGGIHEPIPDQLAVALKHRALTASAWLPMPPPLDASPSHTSSTAEDAVGEAAEQHASHNTFASLRLAKKCSPRVAYALTLQRLQAHTNGAFNTKPLYPLPADHLLSLIYYNVYRGILLNIAILGLDLDLMTTDEYPSPFLPLSSSASSAISALPPQLMPTKLQKTMAHHPQWDIFPDPMLRDNALNYGEENIDDLELCLDMVGSQSRLEGQGSDDAGVYIWGEPWDIASWELSAWMLKKYWWLFKGSGALESSTNRWRRQRGERLIDFERLLEEGERACHLSPEHVEPSLSLPVS